MNSVNKETINHEGIVNMVDDKSVIVRISSESACSGCHAEGSCTLSGKEEKIIEVSGSYNVKPGDRVTILMEQSAGYTALFLGYLLPLIAVIAILIILNSLNVAEWVAGVCSIATLAPYYILLYFFRRRINGKFTFSLKA